MCTQRHPLRCVPDQQAIVDSATSNGVIGSHRGILLNEFMEPGFFTSPFCLKKRFSLNSLRGNEKLVPIASICT